MVVTKKYLNELTYKVIGCAIEVHKHLGPGLLESVYEKCFLKELFLKGKHKKVRFGFLYITKDWNLIQNCGWMFLWKKYFV